MKKILKITLVSILAFFSLILIIRFTTLLVNGYSVSKTLQNLTTPLGTEIFWKYLCMLAIVVVLYGLRIYIVKYNLDKHKKPKAILYSILLIGGLIGLFLIGKTIHENNDQINEYDYKVPQLISEISSEKLGDSIMRGANVFGWEYVTEKSFKGLDNLGIQWVTIMPFEYQESTDTPKINYLDELPNFRKKDSTFIDLINLCHNKNIKVMLKPHLWIESGWRNELKLDNNEDWNLWFNEYRKIALQYAKVANQSNAEIYCIGTELIQSVEKQPEKWKKLITEIREIYKGKLTYAANWNKEYKEIPFWQELDFIGIQAYYPMKIEGEDSVTKLRNSVRPYLDTLAQFSSATKRKIIFTEVGYRSIENNTNEPWKWPNKFDVFSKIYSEKSQAQAYKAIFSESFGKKWFAGAFIWEYDFEEDNDSKPIHRYNFSPRHKTATEAVIKDFYSKSY